MGCFSKLFNVIVTFSILLQQVSISLPAHAGAYTPPDLELLSHKRGTDSFSPSAIKNSDPEGLAQNGSSLSTPPEMGLPSSSFWNNGTCLEHERLYQPAHINHLPMCHPSEKPVETIKHPIFEAIQFRPTVFTSEAQWQDLLNELVNKFNDISSPVYQANATKLLQLLNCGWEAGSVTDLIKYIPSNMWTDFMGVVEVFTSLPIKAAMFEEAGRGIAQLFSDSRSHLWLEKSNILAFKYHFLEEPRDYIEAELYEKLLVANKENQAIQEMIQSGELQKTLAAIRTAENKPSAVLSTWGSIPSWNAEDIQIWKNEVTAKKISLKEHLPEVLAIIKRAVFLAHGITPRTIQIISVLLFYRSDNGRLAQIATGQGKSLIVAILAALKALEGKQVDVVTSSSELAKRDAKEQEAFFGLFGLTVDFNNRENSHSREEIYKKNIVYGTVLDFAGDLIGHEHLDQKVRGDRPLDCVIVDEVDNMLIDEGAHIVRLSSDQALFEQLEPVLVSLWYQLLFLLKGFSGEDLPTLLTHGERIWELKNLPVGGDLTGVDTSVASAIVQDPIAFISDLLTTYAINLIDGEGAQTQMAEVAEKLLSIPPHLREFARKQIPQWIESAIRALFIYEKDKHYILEKNNGSLNISPQDYENTGVTQSSTQWSYGLHQFLQIKHGLKITPESLSECFMSNLGFFKRYGTSIYGMTGTAGAIAEQNLVRKIYGIDVVEVPTYQPKRFEPYPPLAVTNVEGYKREVIESVLRERAKGRAVLVVAQTIAEVERFQADFIAAGVPSRKINTYAYSNVASEKAFLEKDAFPGQIIIATNLAGRGTDIITSKEVEANGGLHVCVTFLPVNQRVENQAFGRTARSGKWGTAQVIFLANAHDPAYTLADVGLLSSDETLFLLDLRNKRENLRLKQDRLYRLTKTEIQDDLFQQFSLFVKDFKIPPLNADPNHRQAQSLPQTCYGNDSEQKCKTAYKIQSRERWAIWLHEMSAVIHTAFEGLALETEQAQTPEAEAAIVQKVEEYKKAAFIYFNNFIAHLNEQVQSGTIFNNPSILAVLARNNNDDSAADQAIAVSGDNKVAAYLAKAAVAVNQSNKHLALTHFVAAKENIEEVIIPRLQSDAHMIAAVNPAHTNQDIMLQKKAQIAFYQKHLDYTNHAISVIENAPSEAKIRSTQHAIGELVAGEEFFKAKPDSWNEDLQELARNGLHTVMEVEAYIEEDKDWWGSVFSFCAGIVQIAIGVTLIAIPGVFAASFGVGMIIEGIGDIWNTVQSIVTDTPLGIDSFVKGKGISYAVNLISSGVLTAVAAVNAGAKGALTVQKGAAKGMEKGAAQTFMQRVWTPQVANHFLLQGTTRVLSAATATMAKHTMKEHREIIENGVTERITQALEPHLDALRRIMASDAWCSQKTVTCQVENLKDRLLSFAHRALGKYATKFDSIAKTITEGVASRVIPFGALLVTAYRASEGFKLAMEATKTFFQEILPSILNLAGPGSITGQRMLEVILLSHFNAEGAAQVIKVFEKEEFVKKGDLQLFDPQKIITTPEVLKTLSEIFNQASAIANAPYTDQIAHFRQELITLVTNAIMGIATSRIAEPVVQFVASQMAEPTLNWVGSGITGLVKNIEGKEALRVQADALLANENLTPEQRKAATGKLAIILGKAQDLEALTQQLEGLESEGVAIAAGSPTVSALKGADKKTLLKLLAEKAKGLNQLADDFVAQHPQAKEAYDRIKAVVSQAAEMPMYIAYNNLSETQRTALENAAQVGGVVWDQALEPLLAKFEQLQGIERSDTLAIIEASDLSTSLLGGLKAAKGALFMARLGAKGAVSASAHALRNTPGKVTASDALPQITDGWLKGTHGNAGKVPKQIADKMKGREFKTFDDFRRAFWKEVANDPVLAKGFSTKDLNAMRSLGRAPAAHIDQRVGGQVTYQLHHSKPVQHGGSVYDLDNIVIVTPRYHQEILDKAYHMGQSHG